jgi:multiple sugar transport system permease protein
MVAPDDAARRVATGMPRREDPALRRFLRSRAFSGYAFLAPALIVTIAIMLYPLGFSLWTSFEFYQLARPSERAFTGLDNYVWAVQAPNFLNAITITLLFTVVAVAAEFLLGLGFALLLNKEFRLQGIVRTVLMLPLFLTPSVVGLLFVRLYYPGDGLIPLFLSLFGVDHNFPLLATRSTALPAVILMDVWRTTPFMFVVLLAGMQALPQEVMEAAQIDGASAWQTLRGVTLPLLMPLILIALTIRGMDAFREFDTFMLLTGGGPGQATEVISLMAYILAFKSYDIGRASAVAWVILVLVLGFSIFFVKKLRDMQMES